MPSFVDVAIIGAGPYGLSVAAHLRDRGIDHRIFGQPMLAWQQNMPPGMHLKSDGDASDLSDPGSRSTLAAFCRDRGIAHDPHLIPVSLENFVSYGLSFQASQVPHLETKRLVSLSRPDDAYRLQFAEGETVAARHVVLAIGVLPFKHVPAGLAHLPAELASHSSAYGPLDRFAGRTVTVLGAGSSALDLAALLHEVGAQVTLVTRRPELKFHGSPTDRPRLLKRVLRYRPPSKIGDGWVLRFCDDAPHLIHLLPERQRLDLVRRTLGPSGGYFVRDRVLGRVDVRCARTIERADDANGHIRLVTAAADGVRETIECDHLVMATGYRVDLARLDFLDRALLPALRMVEGTPVLSANYESSVPGLHFVGLAAANSFGPVMRFVAGAKHPAFRLGRHLSHSLPRKPMSVPEVAKAA